MVVQLYEHGMMLSRNVFDYFRVSSSDFFFVVHCRALLLPSDFLMSSLEHSGFEVYGFQFIPVKPFKSNELTLVLLSKLELRQGC